MNFHQRRASAKTWLCNSALPLWMGTGFDDDRALFHERLTFNAEPLTLLPRRLMVQCRQLYVLAFATLSGVMAGKDQLERCFESVLHHYRRPHVPTRWVFSVDPGGEVHDPKADSYTLAFLLFAFAWLYRVGRDPRLLDLADEVYAILDGPLAAQGGGVIDALPRLDVFQRQNPNMHLLEASLALYEAARREDDLRRALGLAKLFRTSLFDHDQSALPELHGEGWSCANQVGLWYEPGHHFEWLWLLRRLSAVCPHEITPRPSALLSRPMVEGIDAEGYVIERVTITGGQRTLTRRSWGGCEYLKACAAQAEHLPAEHELWQSRAEEALSALQVGFLSAAAPGLWVDRIDACGRPLSADVPASTLYHVVFALAEVERVFGAVQSHALTRHTPSRPALFLDRDGVLNADTGYPTQPKDIIWIDGVVDAIKLANELGWAVIVVSNQSSIARGYASEARIRSLHTWMSSYLGSRGAFVDAWYHCPFHEHACDGHYFDLDHHDRKPNPGLILRAALDHNLDLAASHLVGDKATDLGAAAKAGVRGHRFTGGNLAGFVADAIVAAPIAPTAVEA